MRSLIVSGLALSIVGSAKAYGCTSQCIESSCGYLENKAFNTCVNYVCGCSSDVQQYQQQICLYENRNQCNTADDINGCVQSLNRQCGINQLAIFSSFQCSSTISQSECNDLKKIALLTSVSDQKALSRAFSSQNKDTMKRLLNLKMKQISAVKLANASNFSENNIPDSSYASEYVQSGGYYFVEARGQNAWTWYFYDGTYYRVFNDGFTEEGYGRPTHAEVDQYNQRCKSQAALLWRKKNQNQVQPNSLAVENYGDTPAENWGDAPLENWGDAPLENWGDAPLENWGDAPLENWGDAPLENWGDAPLENWGDAPLENWGDAPLENWGDAPLENWGDAPLENWGDAPLENWGDAPQENWGDAPLENWGDAPQENWGDRQYENWGDSNFEQYQDQENALRYLYTKRIVVDEQGFKQFVQEFSQLQMEYETMRQQSQQDYITTIQDKYAETLTKVYLEFGQSVHPKVQAFADLLKSLQPNSSCDQNCFYDNFYKPAKYGQLLSNYSEAEYQRVQNIIESCGCGQIYNDQAVNSAANNFVNQSEILKNKVSRLVHNFVNTVHQANNDYHQKELQFTYKYYDFLNRQAVQLAGCDPYCVDYCTDPNTFPLNQVPSCLSGCTCDGGVIRLEDGTVSDAQVSYYAKRNPEAVAFFKKYYPY